MREERAKTYNIIVSKNEIKNKPLNNMIS